MITSYIAGSDWLQLEWGGFQIGSIVRNKISLGMWDSILLGGYILIAFFTANSIFLALDRFISGLSKPKKDKGKKVTEPQRLNVPKPRLTVSKTTTQSPPKKKEQSSPVKELGSQSKIEISNISLTGQQPKRGKVEKKDSTILPVSLQREKPKEKAEDVSRYKLENQQLKKQVEKEKAQKAQFVEKLNQIVEEITKQQQKQSPNKAGISLRPEQAISHIKQHLSQAKIESVSILGDKTLIKQLEEGEQSSINLYIAKIAELESKLREAQENSIHLQRINSLEAQVFSKDAQLRQAEQQAADIKDIIKEGVSSYEENQARQELVALRAKVAELQGQTPKITVNGSSGDELAKRVEELQAELQFAQQQLKQGEETEAKIKAELQGMKKSQMSKKSFHSGSQGEPHHELLRARQDKMSKSHLVENDPATKQISYASPVEHRKAQYGKASDSAREFSPSFQAVSDARTPSDRKVITRVGLGANSVTTTIRPVSTIYPGTTGSSLRPTSTTSSRKQASIHSSIHEGGIMQETFFGESAIVGQREKDWLLSEIHHLKKISVKKTRLLHSSLGHMQKPISEYVSNVPNVIVTVQLSNNRMVGAFTQSAFSRQLHSHLDRVRHTSIMTKAMLFDISSQRSYRNATGQDVIKIDNNQLVWGKNEFVLATTEPYTLSCDLNCQNAVYPTSCSTKQFLESEEGSVAVKRFEVYRLFLG